MGNYFVSSGIKSLIFLAVVAVFFLLIIKFCSQPLKEHDKISKSAINGRILNYSNNWQKDTSDQYFRGSKVTRELKYTSPDPMISAYSACTQISRIARLRHTSTDILLRLVNRKMVIEHHSSYDIEKVNVDDLNLTLDSLYPMVNAR